MSALSTTPPHSGPDSCDSQESDLFQGPHPREIESGFFVSNTYSTTIKKTGFLVLWGFPPPVYLGVPEGYAPQIKNTQI